MNGPNQACEKTSRSMEICLAGGLFLLAISVRILYLYDSSDNPTFSAPIVDSMTYDVMAREAVAGAGITQEFFWQQFFYPFFLSIVYSVSNSSVVFARVVQALLGCVTCVLIYRLGERIFGKAAGVLAGFIAAFYGPLIFFEAELLAAGWAAFWAAVLILLLLKTAEAKSLKLCFALGLCGALGVMTRPNFILFLLAAVVWLAVVWLRNRPSAKKLGLGPLMLAAGFCVVTVPVAAKNYQVTDRFSFLPATSGLNLYLGNNPDFEATSIRPGLEWEQVVKLPSQHGPDTLEARQRYFNARTFEYIRTQPMSFLKGILHKTVEFTGSREMPGNIDLYLFGRWSRVLGTLAWKVGGFGFPFGLLLPLAVLGMIFHRRTVPVPVLLFVIFYPASVILTHIEARYRTPVIVVMCVLAGAALVKIGQLVRAKRWRDVTAAVLCAAGLALVCSTAGPFYSERHVNYEAEMYYGLGDSLDKRGRTDEGIESYSKAIGLRSDYVEAHHNLALLLMKRERVDEAVAHLSTAIKLEPDHAVLYKDLGNALVAQEKVGDAVASYNKAVQLDPKSAQAHRRLGLALASLGRFDAAIDHYNQALQIEPDDADTHYSLGVAFQMRGKLGEAVIQYTEALRIEPDAPEAHSNLGVIFARQGKSDQAIKHFTEALRIQPGAVQVLFNLGLVLQSKGQVDRAMQAYERVLEINPAHDEARKKLEAAKRKPPAQ
ncbi:MAG: tetratricopeptide repeat protein [Planctomycetota bacterium]